MTPGCVRTAAVALSICAATALAQSSSAPAETLSYKDACKWLERRSAQLIRGCRMTADDGTPIYVPDVERNYRALWARDFCYMVEGSPDAVPTDELVRAYRLLVRGQRADGAMPDRIEVDGTPTYMPGPRSGPICAEPVADGPQFLVKLAAAVVERTGDLEHFRSTSNELIRGMRHLRRNPKTHLIHITLDESRCPYGFTDTVRKKGDLLFDSLLFVEASELLANLLKRCHDDAGNREWTKRASEVRSGLETLWDADRGYYLAASLRCRQPDVWGTAYAVWLGIPDNKRQEQIGRRLLRDLEVIEQAGQIRHLPAPATWEDCLAAPGTYQNGGYWGTPTGWVFWAIRNVNPREAEALIERLVDDFRRRGTVPEWVSGPHGAMRGYAASVATPLAAVRRAQHGH